MFGIKSRFPSKDTSNFILVIFFILLSYIMAIFFIVYSHYNMPVFKQLFANYQYTEVVSIQATEKNCGFFDNTGHSAPNGSFTRFNMPHIGRSMGATAEYSFQGTVYPLIRYSYMDPSYSLCPPLGKALDKNKYKYLHNFVDRAYLSPNSPEMAVASKDIAGTKYLNNYYKTSKRIIYLLFIYGLIVIGIYFISHFLFPRESIKETLFKYKKGFYGFIAFLYPSLVIISMLFDWWLPLERFFRKLPDVFGIGAEDILGFCFYFLPSIIILLFCIKKWRYRLIFIPIIIGSSFVFAIFSIVHLAGGVVLGMTEM